MEDNIYVSMARDNMKDMDQEVAQRFFYKITRMYYPHLWDACLEVSKEKGFVDESYLGGIFIKLAYRNELYPESAEWFIENGVDINYETKAKKNKDYAVLPALSYACRCQNVRMVEYLLNKGATIHYYEQARRQSDFFYTMVYSKDEEKPLKILKLLLEHGLEVEKEEAWYTNGFVGALYRDRYEIVKTFLDAGGNPNFNYRGIMPIHISILKKNTQMAQLLLERGANPNAKAKTKGHDMPMLAGNHMPLLESSFAITPMDLAKNTENSEMMELLAKYGAKESTKRQKNLAVDKLDCDDSKKFELKKKINELTKK